MRWHVRFDDEFELEFLTLAPPVQDALLAAAKLRFDYGPRLGRPHADTLEGSRHTNMKELRFEALDGEWRAAFAFDPERQAILLVTGDKSGGSQKRFYDRLITKADLRFSSHLEKLNTARKGK